jgi:GNAT superfamily N-acetyltransferase
VVPVPQVIVQPKAAKVAKLKHMTMRPGTIKPTLVLPIVSARHLPGPSAELSSIPLLLSLSKSCGWTHYGAAEWTFLAHAGEVDGWVIDDDGSLGVDEVTHDNDGGLFLGLILRVKYNNNTAEAGESRSSRGHIWGLGMMLVDPKARCMGLGTTIMQAAMDQCYLDDGEDHDSTILLGTVTDVGQLVYEKMGYELMGHVTFLGRDADPARPTIRIGVLGDKIQIGGCKLGQLFQYAM